MGSVVCGAKEGETLDDGDEKKMDPEFCQKLCKKICETDSVYQRDFDPAEPKPQGNAITVCQFKRWATRTVKCNPLWRRSMKPDETITLQDFEKAVSSDKDHVLLGKLLMDIKLAGGDSDLLRPHLKARVHWFGWEIDNVKKYYQEILADVGKSAENDDTLTLDDIKTFGNKQNCIAIRIDYAFGYTKWNEAQKYLDHKDFNAPRFVSFSVPEMQEACKQEGSHQELGQLLQAFAAAVADPGTHEEEVSKSDMFYWDFQAAVDGGAYPKLHGRGQHENEEESKELEVDPGIDSAVESSPPIPDPNAGLAQALTIVPVNRVAPSDPITDPNFPD